jgi:HEPN domain-containing protein
MMSKEDHINFWIESAESDLDVAEVLFSTGKYTWCLFISHLILEKML